MSEKNHSGNDSAQIVPISPKDCFDILEHAPIGVFTSTPEGRFLYVNPALVRMYSYATREELIDSIKDITSQLYADPADRNEFRRLLEEQGELVNYEYRLLRKDGSIFWVSTTVRSVLDEQGSVICYQGFTTDITSRKQAEDALLRKHSFLQEILESSPTPFFSVDRDYRYTSFNQAYAQLMKELYGVDIELGHSLYDYQMVPEDSLKSRINIDRALRGEQFIEEAYSDRQDLPRQYTEVTHNPMNDEHGQVIGVSVFIQDITERKKAEEKLQESEEKYRCLVGQSADMMYLHDLKGHFLEVNQATISHTGYSCEELLSMTVFDIHSGQPGRDELLRMWEKWRPEQNETIETMHLRKDGSRFIAEVKTSKVHFGGKDYILALVRDVTERKQMEEDIKESKARLDAILEQLPVGVGLIDNKGSFILSNSALKVNVPGKGIPSRQPAQMEKWKTFDDNENLVPPNNWPGARALRGETVSGMEFIYIAEDGTELWKLVYAAPFRSHHNKVVGAVVVVQDITKRKDAERKLHELAANLEKKVSERTALAENRSKQLQALAVELIEAEERERRRIAQLLHDDLQQMLAGTRLLLQSASERLSPMSEIVKVQQLLEESIKKSRSLSHELSPPVLDHSGLVAALEWLTGQIKAQFGLNADLKNKTDIQLENAPIKVFAFRAIQELLFNIAKHAGVNSARVEISNSDHHFFVTVSDEGRGFDPEVLNRSGKVGFGLLTIRERANYIGAQLIIDSAPGKGSRFSLKIPLGIVRAEGLQPQTATGAADQIEVHEMPGISPLAGLVRVLFVDDHKVMRQGLIQLISGQPDIHVVGEAANGLEAIDQTRRLNPDVIVMDISMPEMDGIEATRKIKAELPEVRVIGLSMHDNEHIFNSMCKAGAESIVNKASSPAKLLKAIYGIAQEKSCPI